MADEPTGRAADGPAAGSQDDRAQRRQPATVSVVIPTFNCASTLGQQLEALAAQRYEGSWDVVVADNGSTDGTSPLARSWSGRLDLRVVDASGHRGASHARNVGAAASSSEFLAFCDGDDEVDPGWLDALVAASTASDIVAGVLESMEEDPAGRAHRREDGLRRTADFLPFAPSGNFGVWRDAFDATGGFDLSFPRSQDVEWSWRAQLAGFTIDVACDAVVRYRYRTTIPGIVRQAFGSGQALHRLECRYRAAGMRRRPMRTVLRRWAWLPARSHLLLDADRRTIWFRWAAFESGWLLARIQTLVHRSRSEISEP